MLVFANGKQIRWGLVLTGGDVPPAHDLVVETDETVRAVETHIPQLSRFFSTHNSWGLVHSPAVLHSFSDCLTRFSFVCLQWCWRDTGCIYRSTLSSSHALYRPCPGHGVALHPSVVVFFLYFALRAGNNRRSSASPLHVLILDSKPSLHPLILIPPPAPKTSTTRSIHQVALIYFQLGREDHRWWWRSFFSGGSTGLFVYAYSFFYFFNRSDMDGLLQVFYVHSSPDKIKRQKRTYCMFLFFLFSFLSHVVVRHGHTHMEKGTAIHFCDRSFNTL